MDSAIARDGDTVDIIAWRERGRTTGLVEAIFAANPGLAKLGLFLPPGTVVLLPPDPPKATVKPIKRLWS